MTPTVIASISAVVGTLTLRHIVRFFMISPFNTVGAIVLILSLILGVVFAPFNVWGNLGMGVMLFIGLNALFGGLASMFVRNPITTYSIVGILIGFGTFFTAFHF